MLLLIDNYDSFTFHLVHRIGEVDPSLPVCVVRNDALTVEDVERMRPSHIVISPGPGTPRETGVCRAVVERFRGRVPMLGVCLGHQLIAEAHDIPVLRHGKPMHGKTSRIHHDGRGVFGGLPNPFDAARYHSLIVRRGDVPDAFEVSAWTDDDEVMGLRWACGDGAPMDGVQFHPESYLTEIGHALLVNFLRQMPGEAEPVGAVSPAAFAARQ